MKTRCYLESDGRVYLVDRDGKLDLPFEAEIPFGYDRIAPLPASQNVMFCVPRLDAHPTEWMSKDAVPAHERVTSLVREAVHATMPRVVSEAIISQGERILLVKGSRGLTEGRWTLPGGFVRFGEDPAEGLARELKEELGVDAYGLDLVCIRSKLGALSRLHWTMFFYRAAISGCVCPDPDEVSEARWVHAADAVRTLDDPVMRDVLRDFVSLGATRG